MPIHVTDPREWYEPISPERETDDGEYIIGTHRGTSYHLNIRNPQPGYMYYYESNRANRLRRRQAQGYEFVLDSDPEKWGAELPQNIQSDLGGVRVNQDVVLMRVREERYAELAAEKTELAALSRGGTTEQWLDSGHATEQKLAHHGISVDSLHYRQRYHEDRSD